MTATLTATDIAHLRHATELAEAAAQHGNRPFGAIIIDRDGKPLAEAENSVLTDDDIAAHAELNAIRIACRAGLQRQLAGATIYASAEPCPMCTGVILRFGLRRVVYGSSWDTILPALGDQPPVVHVASKDIAALSPCNGLRCLTVTPTSIEQRILARWDEDKIGELIRPRPIDWKKWRAEHLPAPSGPPPGLSKLKADMWRKKQAKGTLRAA